MEKCLGQMKKHVDALQKYACQVLIWKKNWTVIYRNKNNLSFRAVRCQSKKTPQGVKQARKALFKTLQQGRGIEFNSVETKSRGGLSAGLTW